MGPSHHDNTIVMTFAIVKFGNEIKVSLNNPTKQANKLDDLNGIKVQVRLLFRDNLLDVLECSCQTRILQECHFDMSIYLYIMYLI